MSAVVAEAGTSTWMPATVTAPQKAGGKKRRAERFPQRRGKKKKAGAEYLFLSGPSATVEKKKVSARTAAAEDAPGRIVPASATPVSAGLPLPLHVLRATSASQSPRGAVCVPSPVHWTRGYVGREQVLRPFLRLAFTGGES